MKYKKAICCAVSFLFGFCTSAAMNGSDKAIPASADSGKTVVTQQLYETVKTVPYEYYAESEMGKLKKGGSITISFIGDCLFATLYGGSPSGSFNALTEKVPQEYFLEKAMPYISTDDLTIANGENVFTDQPLKEVEKGYTPAFWFRSATRNAGIYPKSSVDIVSLANNHSHDYGEKGLSDTRAAIEKAGVFWTDESKPVIIEKNGIKVGIVSLVLCQSGYQEAINQLKALEKTTDIQIVFFHGGTEKLHAPEQWKIDACHKFIDNGADLVVGGHPHVLQPLETYKGKQIIYSIGNFCFGGASKPENRTIIYQETFTLDENMRISSQKENIIPFYVYTGRINNYQPAPIKNEAEKKQVLDFIYQKTDTLIP